MIDRTTKIRWRRRYRQKKRQLEGIGQQAEDQLEQDFFKRLGKFSRVRRFVVTWILLIVLLSGGVIAQTLALGQYYEKLAPAPGGTYSEGIIGNFTNANPLYAVSSVDSAVSKLVFAGLFKYDEKNQLVGDQAEKWSVDTRQTQYTVKLKKGLLWHDGKPVTADDVVYTYQTIQSPDARSPLQPAWQGIKIAAVDPLTVTFTLPNALTAFPYSLVNGIVPKHLLASIPVTQLRSARFNTVSPVGSGPFKWSAIQITGDKADERQEQVALLANQQYAGGAPKLQRFVIRTYHSEDQLMVSFNHRELNAMVGIDMTFDKLKSDSTVQEYSIPLTGEVVIFFRTSSTSLNSQKLRQALVRAVDVPAVLKGIGYPVVPAQAPLLQSQLGYDKSLTQLGYDLAAANKLLDEDGWVKGANGIRSKSGKPLKLSLYSQNASEYVYVTQQLMKYWRAVGVDLQVTNQSDTDFQSTIANHDYDALLYGISVGPDPDVFAYWDSTQADPKLATRFNFSDYKSSAADKALEAGRTRSDPDVRIIKYKSFLETWRNDAPGLALYQPRFLYIARRPLYGFNPRTINSGTDRYATVTKWMVREEKTPK